MATFIYGLYSSDDPLNFRYIGVSKEPLKRHSKHVWGVNDPIKFGENPHKSRWIMKELSKGNTIEISILKQFENEEDAYEEESWLIPHMISSGFSLTNITMGGRGGHFSDPIVYEKIKTKAADSRKTPEFRADARRRGLEQFNSEKARERARQFALKGWETRDRTPWNKGLSAPKEPKFVIGSPEHRVHQSKISREYFDNLKKDEEAYTKYKESRKNAGKKISKAQKNNWGNLTLEQRLERGHKMSMGRLYNKAKKRGWVFELTSIEHVCEGTI